VVASASNDHRLGANEAPPAIISVYLGTQLADVFEQIKAGDLKSSKARDTLHIGVDTLPKLPKDPGDRNRTSPFAFTGNRFEFRAVGSSQSVADPLTAMNTILCDSLIWIGDEIEAGIKSGLDLNKAVAKALKKTVDDHGAVIFNGNGYSAEWHKEAVEKRGLRNLRTTADALPVLKEKEIIELFSKHNVLTPGELAARFEISAEQFIKHIDVEVKLTAEIAKTRILPAAISHLTEQVESYAVLADAKIDLDSSEIKFVTEQVKALKAAVAKLQQLAVKHDFASIEEHMQYYAQTVRPAMDTVRAAADALEGEVADDLWPMPTYMEMLFIK